MDRIVIKSRVGRDGVLQLHVPIGAAEAEREVQITVDPVAIPTTLSQEEWARRILDNAGKWQGDLERPKQGDYEERDSLS